MEAFSSFFLGMIQGATEFLPISSSGHLFLAENFFQLPNSISLAIWLHGASLLAVILFFWKKCWRLFLSGFGFINNTEDKKLFWKLILSTTITAIIGLNFESLFSGISSKALAIGFLVTAFSIFLAEKYRPPKETKFTWKLALFLGIIQAIAIFPGISRSGFTIAFLVFSGIERKKSLEISFLLSIPTILGALIFLLVKEDGGAQLSSETFWLGLLPCFLVALLCIKWMTKLVEKHWIWFGVYSLCLSSVLFFW